MAYQLFNVPPQQPLSAAGRILSGCKASFFLTNSSTPADVYTTYELNVAHTQPVEADAAGRFDAIYLDPEVTYKVTITDANDVLLYTIDPCNDQLLSQAIVGGLLYPQTAAELSGGITPTTTVYPELHVKRYGAVGDGITDDTAAIRRAQAALEANGGGILVFEKGLTYLLTTKSNYDVVVPVANDDFTPETQNMPYHVLMQDVGNIRWQLNGSTLKSTYTSGGAMFLLDGVRNFDCENGHIESVTVVNTTTGDITTSGSNGFACTSQTRDSFNINLVNVTAENVYVPLYVFGDPDSAFRVRGVTWTNGRHRHGSYTVATHDNGDNVTVKGVHSSQVRREYFCYGVDQHDVSMTSDTGIAGLASNIKAYDRDTTRIKFRLLTTRNSNVYNVNLESQHKTTVQASPARLIDIHVDVDNKDTTGNEVAVGLAYYAGTDGVTLQSTMAVNVFDLIKISGIHIQPPVIESKQNGAAAAYGRLNTDDLVLLNGSLIGLYTASGFIDNKQTYSTFTPVWKVNGSATGLTFSSNVGEYWRDGRFVEVIISTTFTSNGAGTGNVSVDLPVAASTRFAGNPVLHGYVHSGGSSIASPIVGFVATGGATNVTLRHNAATGSAALTDTNITDTANVLLHFRYPIG